MRPLIIDSFAGGGGASTGIEMALDWPPDIAINHNAAALALHAANHPDTLHLDSNIWDVTPQEVTRGRPVGLLWASPDCKHFSKAKGGKPLDRNIRDLAWVVVRWAEEARPDVIILENVEEFRTWGPLYEDGKPIVELRGQTFEDWMRRLKQAGYKVQWRELRACDYGAPTIRKRFFMVARRDGRKIVWPKATHGAPDDPDVIAGRKKPWQAVAECIDWSLPCPSIFDTSADIRQQYGLSSVRPLADNTLARVARGMKRYVLDAARPFIVNLTHGGRVENVDAPANTITGANRGEKAVVLPYLSAYYGPGSGGRDRSASIDEPARVIPTENRHALIAPHIMTMRNAGKPYNGADEPAHTITAGGAGLTLVAPVLVGCGGRAAQSRPRGGDEPFATITAKADACVAAAFIAQHNSSRDGRGHPGRAADAPLSTVTAKGSQQSLAVAFVSRQFGTATGHPMEAPAATVMPDGGGGKSQLVAPFLQAYYGTGDGGAEDQPARTITTKDRHGHVEAAIAAPPFSEERVARAREVADFLRAHGFWDEREFVTLTIGGVRVVIVDVGMRMLTPRELYNAQGFPPDYVIDGAGRGGEWRPFTKSVQVSCVGNSVSPPVAAALVAANCGHLAMLETAE